MGLVLFHCSNARSMRPLWVLEEMGLDYELNVLPFPPRVHQKTYLATNPLGTVPYLIDGDVRMSESPAICHYLVERYGPTPLAVNPDEPDYASYLNWLYMSDATLTFPQTLFLRYTRLEPEERRNPQAAEDYRRWFHGRLRSVEAATADRQYLCAGRFTIADVCVAYALHLATSLGLDADFKENTARYFEHIKTIPSYQRACAT
ncbi:MAG: glutathione S-transferase family protein [Chromatiales bacterium]|jgi:glutathione S-transferase|nr:glutathione S-transferase family protein [Chromatiales bacterium]